MLRSLFMSCRNRSRCDGAQETKASGGKMTRLDPSVLAGGTGRQLRGLSQAQYYASSGASIRHRPGGNRSSPKVSRNGLAASAGKHGPLLRVPPPMPQGDVGLVRVAYSRGNTMDTLLMGAYGHTFSLMGRKATRGIRIHR
jgi:hypothetical protein